MAYWQLINPLEAHQRVLRSRSGDVVVGADAGNEIVICPLADLVVFLPGPNNDPFRKIRRFAFNDLGSYSFLAWIFKNLLDNQRISVNRRLDCNRGCQLDDGIGAHGVGRGNSWPAVGRDG